MEKYRPVCVYAAVGDNCRFHGVNAVTAFFNAAVYADKIIYLEDGRIMGYIDPWQV